MSEIEKYYNGEIHVDFEDDSLTYKELEELLYFWLDKYKEKEQEIKRLHSIIKEVREYIKAEKVIKEGNALEQITNYEKKLLEILDKENK